MFRYAAFAESIECFHAKLLVNKLASFNLYINTMLRG